MNSSHKRTPRQPTSHKSGFGPWLTRLLLISSTTFGAAILMLLTIVTMGMVTGEEFSPNTFQRRFFVYYQLPLVRIQITPVSRNNATNRLQRFLISHGLVPQSPTTSPRWDVVHANGAGIGHWSGDAAILCHYLDQRDDDGNSRWLRWSKNHPKLAKCLWPTVAHVARQQLYALVPDLIHLAQTTDEPAQFDEQISLQLANAYLWLGETHQQLAQHARAVTYFTEALQRKTNWAKALRGRAASYQALGRHGLADDDLEQAVQLNRHADT